MVATAIWRRRPCLCRARVDGKKGWLCYRGLTIEKLADNSSYEETAYLLLFGALPKQAELDDFCEKLCSSRAVPAAVIDALKSIPKETHPMDALRTGISVLGCCDPKAGDTSVENATETGIRLISQTATIAAAFSRIRRGNDPVAPDDTLGHTANFLYMVNGEKPDAEMEKVMDIALILHADHGMNVSTFTAMVVGSSLSDLYSAITAAVGSLRGPLHGGANEQVLYQLEEIGGPDNVEAWYKSARSNGKKIMGFGHRVYKTYDPRAKVLEKWARTIAEKSGLGNTLETAHNLETSVVAELGKEKHIFPNVDFYSGIIYKGLGFEAPLFTPIFAVSRVAGWVARVLEYLPDNRLFRPRGNYVGPLEADYIPMDKR